MKVICDILQIIMTAILESLRSMIYGAIGITISLAIILIVLYILTLIKNDLIKRYQINKQNITIK